MDASTAPGEAAADAAANEGSDYELEQCCNDDGDFPGAYRTVEGPSRLAARRTMVENFECEGWHAAIDPIDGIGGRARHGKKASAAQPREATVVVTDFTEPYKAS